MNNDSKLIGMFVTRIPYMPIATMRVREPDLNTWKDCTIIHLPRPASPTFISRHVSWWKDMEGRPRPFRTVFHIHLTFQGPINCIYPDEEWLLSSGSDGRVAIWMWEADQFLHQIGSLFITNLPILSVFPCGRNELICTLDSYILSLHIQRNPANRRQCSLRQNPRGHVKLEGPGGKVAPSSRGMAVLRGHGFDPQDRLFLVLRDKSKDLEVIGQDIGLSILSEGQSCLAFHYDNGKTAMAVLDESTKKPSIMFRMKKDNK